MEYFNGDRVYIFELDDEKQIAKNTYELYACLLYTSTKNLPDVPGGKKLVYTHINMPMTAIDDFSKLGEQDPFFKELDAVCKKNRGLWSAEAEKMLLEHFR